LTFRELSSVEMEQVHLMFDDFKILFKKESIPVSEINEVLAELKTPEAKSFIQNLRGKSKPETALSDAFFAGQSLLLRYFATDKTPEVHTGNGFIDFKIFSGNRFINLELKPLFDKETRDSKSGKETTKLIQKKLDWKDYSAQIKKYVKQDGEYVVITNLKDWYFFDESIIHEKFEPFYETNFEELEKNFSQVENFYSLIERIKDDSSHEDLDKQFFEDLQIWVDKLRTVDFNCEDNEKLELVLGLINKFIFIQTLHDHRIIEFKWLEKRWKSALDLWGGRKFEVLDQFFKDTIEFFSKSYDTELFLRDKNEINLLIKNENNVNKLYNVLKMVLGFSYLESSGGVQRGMLQYKFNFIDEDIFGRAYETYLAKERHDEGIYYTPSYITQYIVENTVGKVFDKKVEEIKNALESEEFDLAQKNLIELTELKVLDPACGSGSFLVKAFRIIWEKYYDLSNIIRQLIKKYDVYDTLTRKIEVQQKADSLNNLKKTLGFETKLDLISKLMLRHIYGNDLDPKAVSVTKVNLWLEAIKQSPKDFMYEKLPSHTNRILPYLDINIVNGDTVVGLSDESVVDFLAKNHKNQLSQISQLRLEYIDDSTKEGLIDKIVDEKKNLNEKLSKEFAKYLEEKKFPSSVRDSLHPLYWPVDFWHFYFKNSQPLPISERGVDCVIGNPPYISKKSMKKKSSDYVEYLNNSDFESIAYGGNYDLAVIFIEKGLNLLKKEGVFSYIVTNKFFLTEYGKGLRTLISNKKAVKEIIDFGDQQVFKVKWKTPKHKKDPTTYTTIITLNNSLNDKFKYLGIKRLLETKEQLEIDSESYTHDSKMYFVNNSDLTSDGWCFLNELDKKIVERTKSIQKLGGDKGIMDRIFQGLITGADPVFILNLIKEEDKFVRAFSKSLEQEVVLEKELTRPLLKGADIKKWNVPNHDDVIIFPYLIKNKHADLIEEKILKSKYPKIYDYFLKNKTTLEARENKKWKGVKDWYAYGRRQNIEQFDQNKIMTKVLADKASFALDNGDLFYFVGGGTAGGYGISLPQNSKISLECLIALLNSSFLDWRHHQCATRFESGFYAYGQMYIENLPIKIIDKKSKTVSELEQSVQNILEIKNELRKFLEIWKHWSEQMSDVEKSMIDILTADEDNIKEGDQKNIWFEKTSFFISKNKELLQKEFDSFKILGNYHESSINIFGVKDNNDELIFELVLKDEKLVDHFYLAINSSIKSRLEIKSLKSLFEKTLIPVLQPNAPTKTHNLMEKVYDEYSKVSSNKFGIVKMEDEIEDLEANIDSIVFKEYGVEESETNYILEDLMLPESYKTKVKAHFN